MAHTAMDEKLPGTQENRCDNTSCGVVNAPLTQCQWSPLGKIGRCVLVGGGVLLGAALNKPLSPQDALVIVCYHRDREGLGATGTHG